MVVQVHEAGLLEAVESPEAAERRVRTQFLDVDEVFRTEARHQHGVGLAIALAAQEAGLRVEARAHFLIAGIQIPLGTIGLRSDIERVRALGDAVRVGLREEAGEHAGRADAPLAIHAVGAARRSPAREVAGFEPVGEDAADRRTVRQVAADAHHGEVGAGHGVFELVGLHVEDANIEASRLARHATAAKNGNGLAGIGDANAATEEEVDLAGVADAEEAGVLKEERPLFREEQVEPIQVDLLIVHFHLSEVSVHGRVQRKAGSKAVLQVAADIAEQFGINRLHTRFKRIAQHVGRDAQIAQRRCLHARQRSGQRQPIQVELARNRRPIRALVLATDVALKVDAPGLVGGRWIAQRAERNRELRRPSLLGDLAAHGPRAVPVDVETRTGTGRLHLAEAKPAAALPFVGHLTVVLDAGRVGAEHEPVLAIAVGVEDHLEAVGVVHRRVPSRIRHDDAARVRVVEHHADVERVGGEDHADLGLLGRRLALIRLLLHEAGDWRGRLPRWITQHITIERRNLSRSNRARDVGGAGFGLRR